ncbi:MAG: tRNA (adenosine(37)-N6)-threonylcarbamoyltransferase complex ATPase subunit type 1 TsaE [Candidatus Binatus sp.]|jgi:tRNA threonylcarbamoyladenosine biosynthesis protein TsaE|uniref:tRNA (adenosine(37)-N6)-threonylcarbamoyltransferase complex ATPase subunit type 1 TsaE n=1 Tax=Candidatus Binatus sp. TaxID=2811406 RepID=UPI003D12F708
MANQAVESGASVVTMVIESRSPHETKSWGRRLASLLEGGELLGLIGDLGAGKTCFIKGLARGLNLREEDILSPTFTMIQEHHGRLPLYHIDLYRLEEATLDDLGLREYLFSDGIAAVEWFERLRGGAEMEYLAVRISYAGANLRRIEFSAVDSRHAQIISKLKRRFA